MRGISSHMSLPRPSPSPCLIGWSQGPTREGAHVESPGPWGKRENGRGEVSVPHWSGPGVLKQPPLHTHTHRCTHTPAPQPQPLLTESAPPAMRLSLLLLLPLLGTWAIPGGFGDEASLTATAPELDYEEKFSTHMPTHLRCDACRAVAYQVSPPSPSSSPAPTQAPSQARPFYLPQVPPLAFDPQVHPQASS